MPGTQEISVNTCEMVQTGEELVVPEKLEKGSVSGQRGTWQQTLLMGLVREGQRVEGYGKQCCGGFSQSSMVERSD